MKLHHILSALLMIVGITAVALTYQFGIKPRYQSLAQLLKEEEKLRDQIAKLEKRYNKTKPELVVNAWKEHVQPWLDAESSRLPYFDSLPGIEYQLRVPEEVKSFPKFWYIDKREELLQQLEDYVRDSGCEVPKSFPFFPPDANAPGWHPDIEMMEESFSTFLYGSSFLKFMIDNNAQHIQKMTVWPASVLASNPEGRVQMERAGYQMVISYEDLIRFLGQVHKSNTYVSVDTLKFGKAELNNPDAPITISLIYARTRYIPNITEEGAEGEKPIIRRRQSVSKAAGKKTTTFRPSMYTPEELKRMREVMGPTTNPNIFRVILRYLGFG